MKGFDGSVHNPVAGWMWIEGATASSTATSTWANISGFSGVAKALVGCSYSLGAVTITAPVAEVSFLFKITWSAGGGSRRGARLLHNGVNILEIVEGKDSPSEQVTSQVYVPGLDVVAGDVITMQGWQNSGGALTVVGGDRAFTQFHIRRVN